MNCIYCESTKTRVTDTGKGEKGGVYRERLCLSCNRKFYTKESSGDSAKQMTYKRELHRARLG